MFIATILTITKIWTQPKCPLRDERVKKMWCIYIYTMEYCSAIKKNETMPFVAAWMNLEIFRERQRSYDMAYMQI